MRPDSKRPEHLGFDSVARLLETCSGHHDAWILDRVGIARRKLHALQGPKELLSIALNGLPGMAS